VQEVVGELERVQVELEQVQAAAGNQPLLPPPTRQTELLSVEQLVFSFLTPPLLK